MDFTGFLVGMSYGLITFGTWSYVTLRRWRAYRASRTTEHWRRLVFVLPLWLMAVFSGVGLVVSAIMDVTDLGSAAVRSLIGGMVFGAYGAAGIVAAMNEREADEAAK